MKVLSQGQMVKTKIGGIEAMIVGVSLRGEHYYYQISYFASGDHKETWIYPFELDVLPTKTKAGFSYSNELTVIE